MCRHFCRYNPEKGRTIDATLLIVFDGVGLIGFPFSHRKGIRHDTGTGLEIENLRRSLRLMLSNRTW